MRLGVTDREDMDTGDRGAGDRVRTEDMQIAYRDKG